MKTIISATSPVAVRSPRFRLCGMAAAAGVVLVGFIPGVSPVLGASASFVQKDTTTQGTWINSSTGVKIYGADGYLMMGSNYVPISALPGYVSRLTYPGFLPYVWREPSAAIFPRDLQVPVAPYTSRIASGWYFWPGVTTDNTIVLNLTDSEPHLMAMYLEDADSIVRRESIQILDAASDALLNTQDLTTPFDQGVWLQWKITGNIKIKVILTADTNTAHMGFFFDRVPSAAYVTWLTRFSFAAGANMMPSGDPDGDGMSNQQEFAFGLDPTLGSSVNPITTPLVESTGKFHYTRFATSALSYSVLASTDLLTWTPAAVTQSVTATLDGVEDVEVTLTAPPPPGGNLFVRVAAQ
ncbi:MAG: hypothetical protein WCK77_02050 [Verrucomicrobiota bacterium]